MVSNVAASNRMVTVETVCRATVQSVKSFITQPLEPMLIMEDDDAILKTDANDPTLTNDATDPNEIKLPTLATLSMLRILARLEARTR